MKRAGIVLLAIAAVATASQPSKRLPPPPEVIKIVEEIPIPWDTVWMLEFRDSCGNLYGDTLYPVLFITRDLFDVHVLNKEMNRHRRQLQRALDAVRNELRKRKEKKP
jgi:hypothetical protein